jgi:hypothetical protein
MQKKRLRRRASGKPIALESKEFQDHNLARSESRDYSRQGCAVLVLLQSLCLRSETDSCPLLLFVGLLVGELMRGVTDASLTAVGGFGITSNDSIGVADALDTCCLLRGFVVVHRLCVELLDVFLRERKARSMLVWISFMHVACSYRWWSNAAQ